MAKCNLGKVNLEAMLVSSFPSYSWGGPMPLAGAPRDLYTQLLACSSSQSVVAIARCLRASCRHQRPSSSIGDEFNDALNKSHNHI